MSEAKRDIPWLPLHHFENQAKIKPEDLLPYAGQYIAWNWDGDRIVASAPTREELWEKLDAMGEDSGRVVFEFVDDI
jgi:hypothetical protein